LGQKRKKTQQSPRDFKFRVISGSLKGRLITAPDLGVTRPPLTRLRKSIFDYLSPRLSGSDYLDLFSGTGSYLFEAISRGAGSATGIEREPRLVEAINANAEKLEVSEQITCYTQDVFQAIEHFGASGRKFDIIMMAPPQYRDLISATLAALKGRELLREEGVLLCQHDTIETERIDWHSLPIKQRRKYGNTTFTIIESPRMG